MTNLAILCCLDANDVCTGAGCLRALRERRGGFACYEGQETELLAFLRCSHCSTPLEEDAGMQEKLECLVSIGTQAVHIGVCAQPKGEKCPYMAATQVAGGPRHSGHLEDPLNPFIKNGEMPKFLPKPPG